jgi:hypothetical protein
MGERLTRGLGAKPAPAIPSLRRTNRMLVALMLAACTPNSEEGYADAFADAQCARTRECARGYFESEFSDNEECFDDLSDQYNDLIDYADDADCDFDPEEAAQCLSEMRSSSCEDWYEGDLDGCDKIYDCQFNWW